MNIEYPKILYALFLLLVPVVIHLVRWKKYKKELFSNVAFLKDLELKSRRSRKLKELVVLLLRILAFASLIFAFSQPYFPSDVEKKDIKNIQQIIYIDNSLSMSALTKDANLWQAVLQDLVKNLNDEQHYTLLTNEQTFKDISGKQLKEKLYQIKFSVQPTKHASQIKKANFLFAKSENQQKDLIYISDFQNVYAEILDKNLFSPEINYHFYPKQTKALKNMSIDSLWLVSKNGDNYHLRIKLSANDKKLHSPVSIMQGEHLLWRSRVDFQDTLHKLMDIKLSGKGFEARAMLKDQGFRFDNELYFTLSQPEKIKVLVLGKQLPTFLKKIYTPDEFVLDWKPANQTDYGKMSDYDLIVLNELADMSQISFDAFNKYVRKFGNLCLIPNMKKPMEFKKALKQLKISTNISLDTTKVLMNQIHFEHPLLKNVYLKKTKNFAYPFVKQHFRFSNAKNWIYKLNDNTAFVSQYRRNGNIFVFAASLQSENTNFSLSPSLVVPVFYQISKANNKKSRVYFVIGAENKWKVAEKLNVDEVLKLRKGTREYIPFQINQFNSVSISTTDFPDENGIYEILKSNQKISTVAYNFNRKENVLNHIAIPQKDNIDQITTFGDYVARQEAMFQEKSVWKWFLWSALLFLLLEFLVIRFWKEKKTKI